MRGPDYEELNLLSFSALNRCVHGEIRAPKEALILGSEVHRRILEPYIQMDFEFIDKPALEGPAAAMVLALMGCASFYALVSDKHTKKELYKLGFIEHKEELIPFKGILDLQNNLIGADIKTTSAKDRRAFLASIKRYNYRIQALIYKRLADLSTYIIYGVQKVEPYAVFVEAIEETPQDVDLLNEMINLYIARNGKTWRI